MIVCLIISILYFHTLFGITAISLKCGMLLTVFSIVTEPLFRYLTIVVEKLDDLITRLHEKKNCREERGKNKALFDCLPAGDLVIHYLTSGNGSPA